MASIRFSRQAHGADVREQGVLAAMNLVPPAFLSRPRACGPPAVIMQHMRGPSSSRAHPAQMYLVRRVSIACSRLPRTNLARVALTQLDRIAA